MKVTIDTKEDSYEDMAKVLHILTNILEKKGTAAAGEGGEPVDTTSLMSMFSSSSSADKKEVLDKAPDFGSFLNLTNKGTEKKEEKLEIEYF